tara:strand:+ start:93 stop:1289 length:1197 start_codon:yes stop_codon:yes gene_type:complete
MAETKGTRGLDYSLSGDVLRAYEASLQTPESIKAKTGYDTGLVAAGEEATKVGAEYNVKLKKAQEEEKVRFEKAKADAALWEKGYDWMGNRGSWASGNMFDKYQGLETEYRDAYIDAVNAGDIQLQERLLKEQEHRGNVLQEWSKTFDASQKMYDEDLWAMNSMSSEDKHLMSQLHLQDDFDLNINPDNGEMEFSIKDMEGNPRIVTMREVNDIMKKNTAPSKLALEFQTKANNFKKQAKENPDSWNHGAVMAANRQDITRDNIRVLFYEDFTGDSTYFKDTLRENPELKMWLGKDGVLQDEEYDAFVEHMLKPENFDHAQETLAEYMTLKNRQSFNTGLMETFDTKGKYWKFHTPGVHTPTVYFGDQPFKNPEEYFKHRGVKDFKSKRILKFDVNDY